MPSNHEQVLEAEAATWCMPDHKVRSEKLQREVIRYPKLIKDLLLDKLNTHTMDILDVGGGPVSVASFLAAKSRVVLDPLTDEYKKYFSCRDHIKASGEAIPRPDASFDLAISTNALDHTEDPLKTVSEMDRVLRPGGFMALMCAENNALTNPHPSHKINLTTEDMHEWLDPTYETVWELNYAQDKYRYGWVLYEGKVGQPAWAMLMRKTVGYTNGSSQKP